MDIEIYPDSIDIEGDAEDVREHVQARIEELTAALADVDEDDPQHALIEFELQTLIEVRNTLEESA